MLSDNDQSRSTSGHLRHQLKIFFFNPPRKAMVSMKNVHEVQTSKNCPTEIPEGSS
jgi:hypothetical protein